MALGSGSEPATGVWSQLRAGNPRDPLVCVCVCVCVCVRGGGECSVISDRIDSQAPRVEKVSVVPANLRGESSLFEGSCVKDWVLGSS